MSIEVAVEEIEFRVNGEDEPPINIKQIRVFDSTATDGWNDTYLDPDEADQLVDKLIRALYDVDYYDDPFAGVETQEED